MAEIYLTLTACTLVTWYCGCNKRKEWLYRRCCRTLIPRLRDRANIDLARPANI